MSFNRIFLMGNLGDDAEVYDSRAGDQVKLTFRLATNEKYRAKDGELKEETQWHRVFYWAKPDTALAAYLRKGTPVLVEGSLIYHGYTDKDGISRTVAEIKASDLRLLGKKPTGPVPPGDYQSNGMPTDYQPASYFRPKVKPLSPDDLPDGF